MNFTTTKNQKFTQYHTRNLADYITALKWNLSGKKLAVVSAAGEVVILENNEITYLQTSTGKSIDCVDFSADGKYLAAGGQDGKIQIWRENQLIETLENAPAWVDQLAWHPHKNHVAFSLGKYVQIWDVETAEIIVTLPFDNYSSILGIDWRKDGKYLAISGYKGLKIWDSEDWDDEPYILQTPTVSVATGWSPDGKYLASGNMDRSVTVLEWGNPDPWVMRGFPGKIRQLAWSEVTNATGAPLLASSSVDGVVVWEKSADEELGWEARVLSNHVDIINAIAYKPQTSILASAGADGWLCLWNDDDQVSQVITGVSGGFSTLAWHPQAKYLAAGGEQGELLIWSITND
jgi:WD40 repeat protein